MNEDRGMDKAAAPRSGSGHDEGRHQPVGESWDPMLDPLFDAAKAQAYHDAQSIDIDRILAVAVATVEGRRSRRWGVIRSAGITVILGGLAVWLVSFHPRGIEIVYSLLFFVVPALAVLRWHLQALDGRGIRPWRIAPTMNGWAAEVRRQRALLDNRVRVLERMTETADHVINEAELGRAAEEASGRASASEFGTLAEQLRDARADARRLIASIGTCCAGVEVFIANCELDPAKATSGLLREIEPRRITISAHGLLRHLNAAVKTAVGLAFERQLAAVTHQPTTSAPIEAGTLLEQAGPICRSLEKECRGMLKALDRLHRLGVETKIQEMERIRRRRIAENTAPAMVAASGWGQRPVPRSVTRIALLEEKAAATDDSWVVVVRRARARAREYQMANTGGC